MELVIFDWNGTLVDDAELGLTGANACFGLYGIAPISLQQFQETFTVPWQEFFIVNGVKEEQIDVVKHQQTYSRAYGRTPAELREGVKETLTALKDRGAKLAINSLYEKSIIEEEMRRLGIFDLFDAVHAPTGLVNAGTRPDKDMASLQEELGITAEDTVLFVGDMIVDIETARTHGFVSVALTNGWTSTTRLEAAKPDHLLDDFSKILDIL